MEQKSEPLLEVKDLELIFSSDFGDRTVTDHISFHVNAGETLGIVGESGCGKSVTSLAIMGLLARNGRVNAGSIVLRSRRKPEGKDLLRLTRRELDEVRGRDISMIFQDALASLNPVFSIGNQVVEAVCAHQTMDRREAAARAEELLRRVGLPDPEAAMRKYPFQLSGGMRQRVMIAMALAGKPELLIADEATTALDVTIQAQIMRMIRDIRREMQMSMLLITHDIGLIAEMSDRVIVMYAGQIVEEADVYELFRNPLHPYTRLLIAATPGMYDAPDRKLAAIPGTVPENYTDIIGCRFADRCPYVTTECVKPQENREFSPGHSARCHLAAQIPAADTGAGAAGQTQPTEGVFAARASHQGASAWRDS
ncbi:ABC transporter ATP-binding protein [Lachnoclostridium sp. Marseille-P6806]|uniref:ABC transporter ATP-binding protein n=1 Tax=Lachnoclostridium sp. Marseille-P6806 TaxID=2364793 RepID=UPI00102F4D17|nr:ABC transporter ATP-binding protein [Lachnoclostridium sp. Marseille-P6806]